MRKLTIVFILLTVYNSNCQDKFSRISLGVGACFQSTLMPVPNIASINNNLKYMSVPYNFERNIQGLGIPVYLRVNNKKNNSYFEYSPNFRYDEIYYKKGLLQNFESVKGLIINHSLSFNKKMFSKKLTLKTGMSVFNTFKTVPTEGLFLPNVKRTSISFYTLDLGLIYKLKEKQEIVFITSYVPGEILKLYSKSGYLTFNLKYFYKLK